MVKVGIVTFHNALSYGAALQSYALQQFTESCGMDAEILDYECDYIEKKYKRLITIDKNAPLKSLIGSVLKAKNKKRSIALLSEFRQKHMKLSRHCKRDELSDFAYKYTLFLSGSDQVFSPTCAGFDTTYLLDFARPEQKYSYAASFGTSKIPEEKKPQYKQLLSEFERISVREESGVGVVRELTDKTPLIHVDPTLLLQSSQWDKILTEPKITEPYILVFNVLKPLNLVRCALEQGKKTGCTVYYLAEKRFPSIKGVKFLPAVSPEQFIGLIKNAEYVYTNSFHGGVFSILYHKKFVMELDTVQSRNIRSEELLKKLNIEGREITQTFTPDPDTPVNWETVDNILDTERRRAQEYLLKIKNEKEIRE
ncbi:MAG: polysaccharide pyruvyl transferase family protein [Oscillospiraceae bacterium]